MFTPDEVKALVLGDLDKDACMKLFEARWWELFSSRQAASLQWCQERLCMPFGEYQRCMQVLLGRPIGVHELRAANKSLDEEVEVVMRLTERP